MNTAVSESNFSFHEQPIEAEDATRQILDGLQSQPKRLPPKFFYDERGSRLFDQICLLEENYQL